MWLMTPKSKKFGRLSTCIAISLTNEGETNKKETGPG